jgi:hypothetical protein
MTPDPALVAAVHRAATLRNARRLSNGEIAFTCPNAEAHANRDAHPSARWNPEREVWHCDVCNAGGGVVDLARRLGISPATGSNAQRETGRWEIRDLTGEVKAIHVRLEPGRNGKPKEYFWERPDGRKGLGGIPVADLPLYGIGKVAQAPRKRVVLVEGQKATDALTARGILAVGTVTGAATIPSDAVLRDLVGHDVVLWSDADKPGRQHMRRIAERLQVLGITHRVADPWPDATGGADAADFPGTTDELLACMDALIQDAVILERPEAPRSAASSTLAGDSRDQLDVRSVASEETSPEQPWLRLADVEPEAVVWLWAGRIPLGKVTLLEGDPDEGKSCVAIDIAARVTCGIAMPNTCDPARDPEGVVFVTAEDGLADTIRPRLDAAGGDPKRVLVFRLDELPQIDEAGLQTIERAMRACRAGLLVMDPLNAFLPEHVDTYKDHHIRRALAPLAALAARTGAAVLVIRHLNKSGGQNAKYRGGGSIGIIGAARSALLAAPDPDDPSRKVLAVNKHNLAREVPALGYEFAQATMPVSGDRLIETVKIRWLGPTTHTVRDLLADQVDDGDRSALDEAVAWLRDELSSGPQLAAEAFKAAARVGIAPRTLQRARGMIATAKKDNFKGGWVWALQDAKGAQSSSPQNLGAFAHLGAFDDSGGAEATDRPLRSEGAKMPTGNNGASTVALPGREVSDVSPHPPHPQHTGLEEGVV